MAILVIPTTTDVPHYSVQVELDGALFTFTLRWNERAGAWFMTVADANDETIVAGIKVVVNFPLLRKLVAENRPAGEIYAVDPTHDGDPGRNDLGGRVLLMYKEAV